MTTIAHFLNDGWDGTLYRSGGLGAVYTAVVTDAETGEQLWRQVYRGKGAQMRAMAELRAFFGPKARHQSVLPVSAGTRMFRPIPNDSRTGTMDERCAECALPFGAHYNGQCPSED